VHRDIVLGRSSTTQPPHLPSLPSAGTAPAYKSKLELNEKFKAYLPIFRLPEKKILLRISRKSLSSQLYRDPDFLYCDIWMIMTSYSVAARRSTDRTHETWTAHCIDSDVKQ
jgi:hypothetical protein